MAGANPVVAVVGVVLLYAPTLAAAPSHGREDAILSSEVGREPLDRFERDLKRGDADEEDDSELIDDNDPEVASMISFRDVSRAARRAYDKAKDKVTDSYDKAKDRITDAWDNIAKAEYELIKAKLGERAAEMVKELGYTKPGLWGISKINEFLLSLPSELGCPPDNGKSYDLHCNSSSPGFLTTWMSGLGDKAVNELYIPGTHDSVSHRGGPFAQCQSCALPAQFDRGIRLLDLRIGCDLKGYHNFVPMSYDWPQIVDQIYDFLVRHPTEAIFFKTDNQGDTTCDAETFTQNLQSALGRLEDKIQYRSSGFGPEKLSAFAGKATWLSGEDTWYTKQDTFDHVTDEQKWHLANGCANQTYAKCTAEARGPDKLIVNYLSANTWTKPHPWELLVGLVTSALDFEHVGHDLGNGPCHYADYMNHKAFLAVHSHGPYNTQWKPAFTNFDFPAIPLLKRLVNLNGVE